MPDEPVPTGEGSAPIDMLSGLFGKVLSDLKSQIFGQNIGSPQPQGTGSIEAADFLKSLAGDWVMDVAGSVVTVDTPVAIERDIVLKLDNSGGFMAAAPAIVASIPNSGVSGFAVAGKIAVEGQLVVTQYPDFAGRFAVSVTSVEVLESQFAIAGDGHGADISLLVSPLVSMLVAKLPAAGLLSLADNDSETVMSFESGDTIHVLKRPSLSADLLSLNFSNCYGSMYRTNPEWGEGIDFDNDRLKNGPVGDLIRGPHWGREDKGIKKTEEGGGWGEPMPFRNDPAIFVRGDRIKATVVLRVSPPGTSFIISGVPDAGTAAGLISSAALTFKSGVVISTGQPQSVDLTGSVALADDRIGRIVGMIDWTVKRSDAGGTRTRVRQPNGGPSRSGPHRLYICYASPRAENSFEQMNRATEKRLMTVLAYLDSQPLKAAAKQVDARDLNQLASAIQKGVNSHEDMTMPMNDARHRRPLSLASVTTFEKNPVHKNTCDRLWALLDPGPKSDRGNCWEASLLMEQMLRMIGVDAVQTHVFGRSTLAQLRDGKNVRTALSTDGTGGRETRVCKLHQVDGKPVARDEWLALNFNTLAAPLGDSKFGLPSINEGEGCVEVGGLLYAGLSDKVGHPSEGRTAAHDLLLQLEAADGQFGNPARKTKFQIWVYEVAHEKLGGQEHDANEAEAKSTVIGRFICEEALPGNLCGVDVPHP